jgi:hypothetical protein
MRGCQSDLEIILRELLPDHDKETRTDLTGVVGEPVRRVTLQMRELAGKG